MKRHESIFLDIKKIKIYAILIIFCILFILNPKNKTNSQTIVNTDKDLDQLFPEITSLTSGGFLITWSNKEYPITSNIWNIYAKIYNENGQNNGDKFRVNKDDSIYAKFSKTISLSNGNILIVWCYFFGNNYINYEIRARIYTPTGIIYKDEFSLVTGRTGEINHYSFNLQIFNDKFILVYENLYKIFNNNGKLLIQGVSEINLIANSLVDGIEICSFSDDSILFLYNYNNKQLMGRIGKSDGSLNEKEFVIDIIDRTYRFFYFKCTAIGYNKLIVTYPLKYDLKIKIFSYDFFESKEVIINNNQNTNGNITFPALLRLNDGGFILSYLALDNPDKLNYRRYNYNGILLNSNILDFNVTYTYSEDNKYIFYKTQLKLVQLKNESIIITFHAINKLDIYTNYENDIFMSFIENCYMKNFYRNSNGICKSPSDCVEEGTYCDPLNVKNCLQCSTIHSSNCPSLENCEVCKLCYDKNTCYSCNSISSSLFFDENKAITYCSNKSKTGFYLSNGIYYKCMQNCKKCLNSFECIVDNTQSTISTCPSGFYLNSLKTECLKCLPNCIACDNPSTCNTCLGNRIIYKFNNLDNCFNKIENCKNYDILNTCTECEFSYFLNPVDKKCTKCSDNNCFSCADDGTCKQCQKGFYLDFNNKCCLDTCQSCESNGICTTCRNGFYFNTKENKCTKCISDNCLTCDVNGICTSCQVGFLPNINKKCILYCIPNCNTCIDNKICSQCKSEFLPIWSKNGEITECVFSNNCSEVNKNNVCIACKKDFFLNSKLSECLSCSTYDSKCVDCNEKECLKCFNSETQNSNYEIISNKCVCKKSNSNCKKCEGNCKFCEDGLCLDKQCTPNCLSCSFDGICEACLDEFTLSNDKKCKVNTLCEKISNGECKACKFNHRLFKNECICDGFKDGDFCCSNSLNGCSLENIKYFPQINPNTCLCQKCELNFIKYKFNCLNKGIDMDCVYLDKNSLALIDLPNHSCMKMIDFFYLSFNQDCNLNQGLKSSPLDRNEFYFVFSYGDDKFYNYEGYKNSFEAVDLMKCSDKIQSFFYLKFNCLKTFESGFNNITSMTNLYLRSYSNRNSTQTANISENSDNLFSKLISVYLNTCQKEINFKGNRKLLEYGLKANDIMIDIKNEKFTNSSLCQINKDSRTTRIQDNSCTFCEEKNFFYDAKELDCLTSIILDKKIKDYLKFIIYAMIGISLIFIFILSYFFIKNPNKKDANIEQRVQVARDSSEIMDNDSFNRTNILQLIFSFTSFIDLILDIGYVLTTSYKSYLVKYFMIGTFSLQTVAYFVYVTIKYIENANFLFKNKLNTVLFYPFVCLIFIIGCHINLIGNNIDYIKINVILKYIDKDFASLEDNEKNEKFKKRLKFKYYLKISDIFFEMMPEIVIKFYTFSWDFYSLLTYILSIIYFIFSSLFIVTNYNEVIEKKNNDNANMNEGNNNGNEGNNNGNEGNNNGNEGNNNRQNVYRDNENNVMNNQNIINQENNIQGVNSLNTHTQLVIPDKNVENVN